MSATVACPHCLTTNRIPEARLADGPKCGKCKKTLFSASPLELSAANVGAILGNTSLPVLVDCWAPWCGPCRSFAPVFEQAAAELEPSLRLAKLDTQANEAIAGRWGIRSIPTLILFRDNHEVARVSGALQLPQLRQWLRQQGI